MIEEVLESKDLRCCEDSIFESLLVDSVIVLCIAMSDGCSEICYEMFLVSFSMYRYYYNTKMSGASQEDSDACLK